MSKFLCRCGNTLSNSDVPNDIELIVYTGRQWESEINIGVINSLDIPLPRYNVWRCPICKRVYLFEQNTGIMIKAYAIED
ncbi:MAG: hypothetical protein FWH46_00065 [Methanimicrococcus sp.]|nr:hypothetical protein [Methanimicrococcus sp.]